MAANTRAVDRVAGAMERHEEWHREHLQDQLAAAHGRPLSRAQLWFACISALSALAASIIAVIALTHG